MVVCSAVLTTSLYFERIMIIIYNRKQCVLYYKRVAIVDLGLARSINYDHRGHSDTQHNDTHHNGIRNSDTQHKDTQHNNYKMPHSV
jgi:hypothetical protein